MLADRIMTTTAGYEVPGGLGVDIATPKDPTGLANVTSFAMEFKRAFRGTLFIFVQHL